MAIMGAVFRQGTGQIKIDLEIRHQKHALAHNTITAEMKEGFYCEKLEDLSHYGIEFPPPGNLVGNLKWCLLD